MASAPFEIDPSAVLTDEDGDDHGMPLEQAEAVARALDHYAVGRTKKAN